MAIQSRSELGAYALRRLGHPVIQINVAPEQIEDCIDDALQKYYEYHGDGSQRIYLKHILTDNDIDTQSITVPDGIMSVVDLLNAGNAASFNINNISHVAYMTDIAQGMGKNGLSNYVQAMSYLSTLDNILNPAKSIRFVKHGNKVRFDGALSNRLKTGDLIIIKCYMKNTAEDNPATYGDSWLKRYTTAQVKKQWANNLIKYNGFQLPSGITIDGSVILSEANADLEALETELRETWEEPIMPLIG